MTPDPDTIIVTPARKLTFRGRVMPCAIGKNGIIDGKAKREGDGKSPAGSWPVREVFYRKDRITLPKLSVTHREITKQDGWCDDPLSDDYNRHVKLPFDFSHEEMWREDPLYDIVIVLGHNDQPVVKDLGSAIFFHLAHDDYRGTEGCIAVSCSDMLRILQDLNENTCLKIIGPG